MRGAGAECMIPHCNDIVTKSAFKARREPFILKIMKSDIRHEMIIAVVVAVLDLPGSRL